MNMKKAAQFANEAGTGQLDRAQRTAYLNSKGINPGAQFQLDLVFPETIGDREDLRHIPNDYARSSIFTARNKRAARRNFLHEKLFHYNEFVTILYTGIELRAEDDEIIWLQILNYGQRVPLGDSFEFSIKDLVSDVGWHKNGRYYDKARKPTQFRVWIDPNLILLFAGNTFTSHAWEIYRDLSPVARRLADYIESHKHLYPLSLEKFQQMCGSTDASITSWRQTVKKACIEVMQKKVAVNASLVNDQIITQRALTAF